MLSHKTCHARHPDARIFRIDLVASSGKVPEVQTAQRGGGEDGVGSGSCRWPARWACGNGPRWFVRGVQMRCRECAAEVAVTARVCSRCGAPIVGQPTVVGAVIRHLRESYEGTNVAGVVLGCASALVGIFFILGSVWLYVDNRDLAAHGVRTQGQVVDADADGSDLVVYTVGGTDYEVPEPEVGDRLPGDAVTVVYDPRDPANSNLEDDSVAWHLHWFFLGFGLFLLGWPAMPVVAGVFEADGPVGRRLARARPARRQPETPPKVAGQAPPEPFVPGSGDKLPAELRLVLAGYAGIACGLFAGALACAAAVVFVFFDADIRSAVFEFFDADIVLSLFLAVPVCGCGALVGANGVRGAQGAYPVFQAAPAAQRSTHGHGDGLEAWWTHSDTRHHPPGRHPPPVPVAVRGSPRIVVEGRHAGAR